MTGLQATTTKLIAGACLYAIAAVALALTVHGSPPVLAYLIPGVAFTLCFKIAGEPLAFIPFRMGGRFVVLLSYFISVLGMGLSIYVLWQVFLFTRPEGVA